MKRKMAMSIKNYFSAYLLSAACLWSTLLQRNQGLGVVALQLKNVVVPETGIMGGSVTLECDFDLESDTLYSFKWYKDDHEFFRYQPAGRPPISTFPVPGINLDRARQTIKKINLLNLDKHSTGRYRCEVSADSSFRTLQSQGNLTVIVPPQPREPILSNFTPTVYMGNFLDGNCTSYNSMPPANLTFYINEKKAEDSFVKKYDTFKEYRDGVMLYTVTLGLHVRVQHEHFRRGAVLIGCSAKILDHKWESQKTITHQNFQPQLASAGHASYGPSKGSSVHGHECATLSIIMVGLICVT